MAVKFEYWLMLQRRRILAKLKTIGQPKVDTVIETRGQPIGHSGVKRPPAR